MNPRDPNVALLEHVARGLGEDFLGEVVFVGGSVVGLLITDPAQPPIRATDDVDVLVEVLTRKAYNEVERVLREERRFLNDTSEGAPVCRWRYEGVAVDLMPTDPALLGFSNRWYPLAFQSAVPARLPSGATIRLVQAPVFLGTKVEAFLHRGGGDFFGSHDLEDLVAVIDGRATIVEEVEDSADELRAYLREHLSAFFAQAAFGEALPGHLPPDAASQARGPDVLATLKRLAGLDAND